MKACCFLKLLTGLQSRLIKSFSIRMHCFVFLSKKLLRRKNINEGLFQSTKYVLIQIYHERHNNKFVKMQITSLIIKHILIWQKCCLMSGLLQTCTELIAFLYLMLFFYFSVFRLRTIYHNCKSKKRGLFPPKYYSYTKNWRAWSDGRQVFTPVQEKNSVIVPYWYHESPQETCVNMCYLRS